MLTISRIDFISCKLCRECAQPPFAHHDAEGPVNFYGDGFITPNMHLHCHLREVIQDYGPVFGFGSSAFKRYNGIIKNIDTSSKNRFEVAFMKQFLKDDMSSTLTGAVFEAGPDPFAYKLARLLVTPTNALEAM